MSDWGAISGVRVDYDAKAVAEGDRLASRGVPMEDPAWRAVNAFNYMQSVNVTITQVQLLVDSLRRHDDNTALAAAIDLALFRQRAELARIAECMTQVIDKAVKAADAPGKPEPNLAGASPRGVTYSYTAVIEGLMPPSPPPSAPPEPRPTREDQYAAAMRLVTTEVACPADCGGCSCHIAPPCGHCVDHGGEPSV